LPYNPLRWEVIASTLNHNDHTLATVLGNDRAIAYAHKNATHAYPAGAVLSVITWSQEEDPRWFGGNIAGNVRSVEFPEVQSGQDHGTYLYTLYGGSPLRNLVSKEEKSDGPGGIYCWTTGSSHAVKTPSAQGGCSSRRRSRIG
jgi:Cytochrome P460